VKTYRNFINGDWIASSTENVAASTNPANIEEILGYFQQSSKEDVDQAVEAAKQVKNSWRKLTEAARGNYLYKIEEIMESRKDEIAETMTREMGKTFPESKGETARGIAILRYFAG